MYKRQALRATESEEETIERRTNQVQRQWDLRAEETKEETNNRLRIQSERQATLRANEPTHRYNKRLRMQAQYQAAARAAESEQESNERRVNQASRQANLRQNSSCITWGSLNKAAFNYDVSVNYHDSTIISIGAMNKDVYKRQVCVYTCILRVCETCQFLQSVTP